MVDRLVGRFRRDAGGSVSRKNANFSLRRRFQELADARSEVVASLALRSKSWTWIVKARRKEGRWNEHARKRGREKSRMMAGKATLRGRNSREVRPVRRCDAGGRGWVASGMMARGGEKKRKKEGESKRKPAASEWIAKSVFLIFQGERRDRKNDARMVGIRYCFTYSVVRKYRGFQKMSSSRNLSTLSFRISFFFLMYEYVNVFLVLFKTILMSYWFRSIFY